MPLAPLEQCRIAGHLHDDGRTRTRIARQLRFEREERDWSLADLAARSCVSKAMISNIEREEGSPAAVIVVRLAGAFDLTLAGLLRARGSPSRSSRSIARPEVALPAPSYVRIRQALWVRRERRFDPGRTRAGEIPDYALKSHGGLTGTLLYWKRIGRS